LENIVGLAESLADEFVNSHTYREYTRLKQKIDDDPELKQKIEAFYDASDAYEAGRLRGDEIHFDVERVLSGQYADIWLNEDGHAYMKARNALYDTLDRVYKIIGEKCGL